MLSQERVFRFAVLGTGRGGGVNMLSQECVFSAYRLAVVERGCIRVYVCVVSEIIYRLSLIVCVCVVFCVVCSAAAIWSPADIVYISWF